MSNKWNIVAFGEPDTAETLTELRDRIDAAGLSQTTHQSDEGWHFIRIPGYDTPDGDRIRFWLIDQLKALDHKPDWAVVTHANDTEDGGRAWVLRNHDDYMDLIDIAIGINNLFGEDVEAYLERDHEVEVPVWMASNPDSDAVNVASIGKAMTGAQDDVVERVLEKYPFFDRLGSLSDPVEETRPKSAGQTERTLTLSEEEAAFFETALADHCENYNSETAANYMASHFDDGGYTGTWDDFQSVVWDPLDEILQSVLSAGLSREAEEEVRAQANRLKWQGALDWHK